MLTIITIFAIRCFQLPLLAILEYMIKAGRYLGNCLVQGSCVAYGLNLISRGLVNTVFENYFSFECFLRVHKNPVPLNRHHSRLSYMSTVLPTFSYLLNSCKTFEFVALDLVHSSHLKKRQMSFKRII